MQLTNPWLPLLTPGQLVEINEAFGKFGALPGRACRTGRTAKPLPPPIPPRPRPSDVDGDGTIVCDELKHVMRHMGLVRTKEQIEAMIASTDVDGNGKIEFDEFVRMMAGKMLTTDGEAELEQAFKLLDADSSGYVTESEIRNLLTKLGSTPFSEAEVRGAALPSPREAARPERLLPARRCKACWPWGSPTSRAASRIRHSGRCRAGRCRPRAW